MIAAIRRRTILGRFEERFADVAGEGERFEMRHEMVVEDAADAAVDVAVGDEEVIVRPFPEPLIIFRVVRSRIWLECARGNPRCRLRRGSAG